MTPDQARFLAARNVSRETLERLEAYRALLERWNARINLVARSTLQGFWTRHVLDSIQLLDLAPGDAHTWCDLGSGAGFPGLAVALLAREERPDLSVTLIESDQRKCTFLRTVARETETKVNILANRIETAPPQESCVLSARALAPLPELLQMTARHIAQHGIALFPKGANHDAERREALEIWRFHCETHPSKTDPDAVIFQVSELSRA